MIRWVDLLKLENALVLVFGLLVDRISEKGVAIQTVCVDFKHVHVPRDEYLLTICGSRLNAQEYFELENAGDGIDVDLSEMTMPTIEGMSDDEVRDFITCRLSIFLMGLTKRMWDPVPENGIIYVPWGEE